MQPIPWENFEAAIGTAIAVRGEAAPVVTITLSTEQNDSSVDIVCEATLMSGASFICRTQGPAPHIHKGEPAHKRARCDECLGTLVPNVDGLARLLLAEMPKHTEASTVEHIFINIRQGDGEYSPITPWNCSRPLSDFIRLNH
mmetsp:Transcript_27619/g.41283  ORF Transcript_27619/g.41283 Transcript_27619/m.41283 type:complete len:143 (+) Transcript_27619:17-445(+)